MLTTKTEQLSRIWDNSWHTKYARFEFCLALKYHKQIGQMYGQTERLLGSWTKPRISYHPKEQIGSVQDIEKKSIFNEVLPCVPPSTYSLLSIIWVTQGTAAKTALSI